MQYDYYAFLILIPKSKCGQRSCGFISSLVSSRRVSGASAIAILRGALYCTGCCVCVLTLANHFSPITQTHGHLLFSSTSMGAAKFTE